MICDICKKGELIDGILEGLSFVPSIFEKKIFSRGVYGIYVKVCTECGNLSNFSIDTEALNRIIKKKSNITKKT